MYKGGLQKFSSRKIIGIFVFGMNEISLVDGTVGARTNAWTNAKIWERYGYSGA